MQHGLATNTRLNRRVRGLTRGVVLIAPCALYSGVSRSQKFTLRCEAFLVRRATR